MTSGHVGEGNTIEGTRNVAEGHEGACWHVGMLARGEAKMHGRDAVAPLPDLIEGTRGQVGMVTRGNKLRGQVGKVTRGQGERQLGPFSWAIDVFSAG